ncbi:MAG: SRPBCC family protein [Dysgonamonadaceae bacterium]|jgi:carbon monoxide dehydrogenase subunit G|nr:SRPBCC family protein [Dysgonamonadaceae bacterium]
MTEFTSKTKHLPHNVTTVYEILSDLNNIGKISNLLPQNRDLNSKMQDYSFDRDSCSFTINSLGNIRISIVEREPCKTIKFASDQSPVDFDVQIHLEETSPQATQLKLTLEAELNPMLKQMVAGIIQNGLENIANILANIPYETLGKEHQN